MKSNVEGLLWIAPTTQYADELRTFAEGAMDTLDLKKFINFSFQRFTPNQDVDHKITAFPSIDWSERRTSWKDIQGVTTLEDSEEWEISWLTGCIDSPFGLLSFNTPNIKFSPLSRTLNQSLQDMQISDKNSIYEANHLYSSQLVFDPNEIHEINGNLHEIMKWKEIDCQMETILSDSITPLSIERLKYRASISTSTIPSQGKWQWAVSVPLSKPPPNLSSSKPILDYPFELDIFQKQAIYHLEQGHSVFIAAHTSAGKTVVAEYAAALALSKLTKAIYTSPIKALSNQKYRDFSLRFSSRKKCTQQDFEEIEMEKKSDNLEGDIKETTEKKQLGTIGLITGDMQVNAESSSLIVMTTEILRSMLMKSASILSDVTTVIFDEIHYMSDPERGVVWEETLIMLPPTIQLVMLSATLPNAMELADWLGRTRGEKIWVIATGQRPVPLEYYLLPPSGSVNTDAIPLGPTKQLKSPALRAQETKPMPFNNTQPKTITNSKPQSSVVSKKSSVKQPQITLKQQPSGFFPVYARKALDWLRHRSLLPAIIFLFSRKRCEEALNAVVKHVGSTSLLTSTEQRQVERFIKKYITIEEQLPQVNQTLSALKLGLACHHSGLLPVLKEAIEMLFAQGLVRLLIATETFAIGVNMPARTVIFGELEKPSGRGRRPLTPAEFTQMAGRAGRRGIDTRGIVIVADSVPESTSMIATSMIEGHGAPLSSQFRLTFGTILQLVRKGGSLTNSYCITSSSSGHISDIGELMRRSFFENEAQRLLPAQTAKLRHTEAALDKAESEVPDCFFGCSLEQVRLMKELVFDHQHNRSSLNNPKKKIIGRFISSASTFTSFLQPGIIIGGSSLVSEESIVQVLLFPIDTQAQWIGPLERPINADASISELFIQSFPLSDLIFIDGDDNGREDVNFLVSISSLSDHANLFQKAIERQQRKKTEGKIDVVCPNFSEHFASYSRLDEAQSDVQKLQHVLSVNSLQLLPEYRIRLRILEFFGFIETPSGEDGAVLTLKGRIACEIQTADELIVTELLVSRLWGEDMPAEDVVALLSLFVFQERTSEEVDDLVVPAHLLPYVQRIRAVARNLEVSQTEAGLAPYPSEINPGLASVIRAWALGQKFSEICQMTEVQEGIIIRTVLRLDETCRDLRNAARIMGNVALQEKLLQASAMIKRDICFRRSLYLD